MSLYKKLRDIEMSRKFNKLRDIEMSRKFLNVNVLEYYSRTIRTWNYQKMVKRRYSCDKIVSVNIETFGVCNRKCDFCFFNERFPKRNQEIKIMKETTYKKIIDELSKMNFYGRISPHGYGEPLLDKRLPTLIEYTKINIPNCYVQIVTNGDFLTIKLLHNLIDKGVDEILITNYDDEEKAFFTSINKNCPYHVKLRSYKDFKKFDRAGKIFEKKLQIHKPCFRPSNQLVVNRNGDVILCCNDFYGEYVMGNVNDSNLSDIWMSKKFLYYRNNLIKGQRSSIPICKHCDYGDKIPW